MRLRCLTFGDSCCYTHSHTKYFCCLSIYAGSISVVGVDMKQPFSSCSSSFIQRKTCLCAAERSNHIIKINEEIEPLLQGIPSYVTHLIFSNLIFVISAIGLIYCSYKNVLGIIQFDLNSYSDIPRVTKCNGKISNIVCQCDSLQARHFLMFQRRRRNQIKRGEQRRGQRCDLMQPKIHTALKTPLYETFYDSYHILKFAEKNSGREVAYS